MDGGGGFGGGAGCLWCWLVCAGLLIAFSEAERLKCVVGRSRGEKEKVVMVLAEGGDADGVRRRLGGCGGGGGVGRSAASLSVGRGGMSGAPSGCAGAGGRAPPLVARSGLALRVGERRQETVAYAGFCAIVAAVASLCGGCTAKGESGMQCPCHGARRIPREGRGAGVLVFVQSPRSVWPLG